MQPKELSPLDIIYSNVIVSLHFLAKSDFGCIYGEMPEPFPVTPKQILECEMYLIEEMGGYLIVFHPYRALENLVNNPHNAAIKDLFQAAWYDFDSSF